MAYAKLNAKTFLEQLKKGKYKSRGGAMRAVGKAHSIPEREVASCYKAIDDRFGVDDKAAKPAKAVTPRVKKQATSIEKPQKRVSKDAKAESIIVGPTMSGSLDDVNSITVQLRIAEKTIQSAGTVLSALIEVKRIISDVDVTEAIERATITLTGAVNIFDSITHKVAGALARHAQEATPVNGGSGKALYQEALPTND